LSDVLELIELLPDVQLAVLPGTTHMSVSRRPAELRALVTWNVDSIFTRSAGAIVTMPRPTSPAPEMFTATASVVVSAHRSKPGSSCTSLRPRSS
jgi:hypothetical protein